MAKFSPADVEKFKNMNKVFLEKNYPDLVLADIKTGHDAWTIASRSGMLNICYSDRTVYDAHIQTVLEKIFPNVRFISKKVY